MYVTEEKFCQIDMVKLLPFKLIKLWFSRILFLKNWLLYVFTFCSNVGKLYFRMEKLRGLSGNNQQSLAGFEKIQTVGKGK